MTMEDAAIRQAAERANRERGPSFCVSRHGDKFYVNGPTDDLQPPKGAELICIAQFWSESKRADGSTYSTVQVRFAGARSEWVYF